MDTRISCMCRYVVFIFILCCVQNAFGGTTMGYHGELSTLHSGWLWNLVTLGYGVGHNFQIEAQAQNLWRPSSTSTWETLNPRLGLSGLALRNDHWTAWGYINIEPPLTRVSRNMGAGLAPGIYQRVEYHPAAATYSFGFEHWLRYYSFSTIAIRNDVYGNASPLASYALARTLQLQTRVSIDYYHIQAYGWKRIEGDDIALEPGVQWHPTASLSLRPFLSFRPFQKNLQTASFGFWMTGRIL